MPYDHLWLRVNCVLSHPLSLGCVCQAWSPGILSKGQRTVASECCLEGEESLWGHVSPFPYFFLSLPFICRNMALKWFWASVWILTPPQRPAKAVKISLALRSKDTQTNGVSKIEVYNLSHMKEFCPLVGSPVLVWRLHKAIQEWGFS